MSTPHTNQDPVIISAGRRFMRADISGFIELSKLNNAMVGYAHRSIIIDVSRIHSFDPALAAPLMIIVRQSQIKQNLLSFRGMKPLLRQQLEMHGLIVPRALSVLRAHPRPSKPPLVYFGLREFLSTETEEFAIYSKKALGRSEMPIMSESLKASFFEGIDELFANSAMHSKSRIKNVSCGVFNTSNNTLKFVFADGGHGIKGAFEQRYKSPIRSDEAIHWAMMPGNTTRHDTTTGGLGLKIIREFINLNGGKLIVVSREGYWMEKERLVTRTQISTPFPGTFVTIEINTADKKSYDLKQPDPNSIW